MASPDDNTCWEGAAAGVVVEAAAAGAFSGGAAAPVDEYTATSTRTLSAAPVRRRRLRARADWGRQWHVPASLGTREGRAQSCSRAVSWLRSLS